jgi:hypothetical protein
MKLAVRKEQEAKEQERREQGRLETERLKRELQTLPRVNLSAPPCGRRGRALLTHPDLANPVCKTGQHSTAQIGTIARYMV